MGKPSKIQHFAATLSLLLPGLGHIYLGRKRRGLALFTAFVILTFFPEGRLFLPFAAVLAAAEIYRPVWRVDSRAVKKSRGREFAFGATGIATFCAWILMFASGVYPFAFQGVINDDAERIADLVRNYRAKNGVIPSSVQQATSISPFEQVRRDPWGRDYEIAKSGEGFDVRSVGPDGNRGTRDDLNYSFR